MLFVIAVEEAELLLAVGRVVGGVHVEDDDLTGAGVGFKVQVKKPVREPAQVFGGHLVFEAGERGLGGQVRGTLWSLAGHDLENRVSGQGRSIVVVFIALGNGEQPLSHQGQKMVLHLVGITVVMEAAGGFVGETIAVIQLSIGYPIRKIKKPP
jgi:hypothetical protein